MYRNSRFCLGLLSTLLVALLGCNRSCVEASLKKESGRELMSLRISHGELTSGMHYYYMRNTKPDGRCFLRLHVAVGSFNEDKEQSGMAHLVEHLAFDNRELNPNETLADWLQKNGMSLGPDANAYTGTEDTLYKIDLPNCQEQSIVDALAILRHVADKLTFSEQAIAKEKNIVDAEDRESNNRSSQLTKKIIDRLYAGTFYVSNPVLGTALTRSKFTKPMIEEFYRENYHPKNLSVVLVGDYGDVDPRALIDKAFGDVEAKQRYKEAPRSPDPEHKTPIFIITEKEMPFVEVIYTIQSAKLAKISLNNSSIRDRVAFDLALSMLRDIFAAQFQSQTLLIRETGIDGLMYDDGVYEFSLNLATNVENYSQAFTNAFNMVKNAAAHGFEEKAFLKARARYQDALDQRVVEEFTWGSDQWAGQIVDHINQKSRALDAMQMQELVSPALQGLSAKDCQEALKKAFQSQHHYLFAIGNIDDTEENRETLQKLLALKNETPIKSVAHDVDFRYHVADCAQPVLALDPLPLLDAFKLKLPNGITVVAKPTKFKSDEIIIEVLTDEGYATMNKRDLALARVMRAALLEGGLNRHPPEEIPQLLSDKFLTTEVEFYENHLQASVATRGRDLRFSLELLRAFIVDPNYNDVVLNRIKEQIKTIYKLNDHSLTGPLQNQFQRAIAKNDYRAGLSPIEDLLSITRDDLLAFHQKYVANKQLGLVIVGDFDLAEVTKNLYCIFGTMESHPPTAKATIKPMTFSTGINQTYNVAAKDEGSLVAIRYPLNFSGSRFPDHRLHILQNVVQEVLRLKMREKYQATYFPNAVVMETKGTSLQNWLDVSMVVKKDQSEKIRRDILQIFEKLATKGINATALEKAKEPYLATAQQNILVNGYWSAILANNFNDVDNMRWVTTLTNDIKAITIKDINDLLKTYLRAKNTSSVIIHAKVHK